MTASISRVQIPAGTEFGKFTFTELYADSQLTVNKNKKYITSLRNTLGYYSRMSPHFLYDCNFNNNVWHKGTQELNLISIPSIFFGNSIKKTSVKLGFYLSGTLVAELNDTKGDGELIETTGPNINQVAGVVLYDHGFVMLTGSWDLHAETEEYDGNASAVTPKWVNFAVGLRDPDGETPNVNIPSASYSIDFKGVNPIPTLTMFAHAKKTEFNISSNPTFVEKAATGKRVDIVNNSVIYPSVKIKNTVKSHYKNYEENFDDIVYISKIGIYDMHRNLLAVANLATPVKKIKGRDYTFKLKLDI